ncbi:energy transducer TonB [Maribacter aestuarii]|uniref:energy transducer TonB n=1 Tax=Maribacter aestuarii TaxID=1130723 RepID=UPI00248D30E3|nr:energy transducer TonB [Maribacter aestuarii]
MKPKKNPKADLNRDSGLFFVLGLTLVLFITWRALEYKSYDTTTEAIIIAHMVEPDLDEEVPLIENIKLPPPVAPPVAPAIIEIVEDAEEIEESVILSTETDQNAEIEASIVSVDDINVDEVEEDVTVPFAVIEDVPVFPGCEKGTRDEQRACFQQKIQEHVVKNFKYPQIALEMGVQGKVYVQFIIDEQGHITNIKSRGPDQLLEKEAQRIIALLPQMIPGKQRGRAVRVPYSIPVNFKLM